MPTQFRRRLFQAALIVPICAACAGPTQTIDADSPVSATPERVVVSRVVVTPGSANSVDELLADADAKLAAESFSEAAAIYDRVAELDPEGPSAPLALFGAGTAYDLGAKPEEALTRYRRLFERFGEGDRAHTARVRATRLLAYLEQYEAAGRLADIVMSRSGELRPLELIAVHGAKALALTAGGDDRGASYYVEKARGVVEAARLDAAGRIPRDVAQLYFALGEVRRIRAERIQFVPVPADFGRVLEERCQLLLDAQSAYSDSMRAEDAHWSAMAGFRVGELYQTLHEALMKVPAPESADTERRKQLFEGAMRLRYTILLEKARKMMKHTLAMAERTGERSEWVLRAERAERALQEAERREQTALDRLPYSRAQLQQALDDLATKKAP